MLWFGACLGGLRVLVLVVLLTCAVCGFDGCECFLGCCFVLLVLCVWFVVYCFGVCLEDCVVIVFVLAFDLVGCF